jgi:hypothetical protein
MRHSSLGDCNRPGLCTPSPIPISQDAIQRQRARTTQHKGRQACHVLEVNFIAR